MVKTGRHLYEFLPFRLEPEERRLLRNGEPVALTPKCFDLLVVLVENSGRLLEKSDLLARVWPDQPVEGPPRTIAVLPFKPLAVNLRDEPLEMGICNALITRLANLQQLVVRPTSSVITYNRMGQDPLAAGRQLRVDALLEGYIQRSQ